MAGANPLDAVQNVSEAPAALEHRFEHDSLMVIIPDRLSDLIAKGEVTARYYNPGELFREVHIVMTNDDAPDAAKAQALVGDAKLFLHNLSAGGSLFLRTLGWRPGLLNRWGRHAVELARTLKPQLVRCHGAHVNAYAALCIKQSLGIPFVVSLHINPDEDVRNRTRGFRDRVIANAAQSAERKALRGADLVMPVYAPIVPFLDRLGVAHYEVAYNVLNPGHLRRKDDYALHKPVKILSVGRQFAEKNPENLLRAVASLDGASLTLVGDGPIHGDLVRLVAQLGLEDRVTLERAVPNDELCESLVEYDIFAVHTEYWELSKSVLEPLLSGLPVVLNRRKGAPVPELDDTICLLVENSPEGYGGALKRLIQDHGFREKLGRQAYEHADAHWSPRITEAKYVDLYRRTMRAGDAPSPS